MEKTCKDCFEKFEVKVRPIEKQEIGEVVDSELCDDCNEEYNRKLKDGSLIGKKYKVKSKNKK